MDNFNFYSPTEFVFGKGRENECGKYIKKYGGTKVLIHYGGGFVVRSGLLDKIKASITSENIPFVELGGVQPNPRDTKVYKGIELCKAEGVDFILAVGGGSVIDSSKAIALGALYDGDFWDFYDKRAVIEKALPVGTVLTIAAAGSEGSGNTVITKTNGMWKRGVGGDVLRPKFSVMNPELTYSLPAYQTACGATDIMAHVLERYFTNTKEVEITDRFCESVLCTIIKEVPKVLKNPEDYDARANIMWAGTMAHNNVCGVGREQDWNSHGLEHELSGLYDCAHGAGLAVMMPAWMDFVMSHNVMRFAQMAVRVFGISMNFENSEETAKLGIQAFRKFLHEIGMPINFAELGVKEEDIPELAEKFRVTKIGSNGTTGGFVKLTKEDAVTIYKIALNASV